MKGSSGFLEPENPVLGPISYRTTVTFISVRNEMYKLKNAYLDSKIAFLTHLKADT